jgi:ArsR family transcriptional regulator
MDENLIIFDLQAKLCQALGQVVRLRIIDTLKDGSQCVTSLATLMDVPQPTVSRHLNVLRAAGILHRQRKGREVYYEIANPKIVDVCEMMQTILAEQESYHPV